MYSVAGQSIVHLWFILLASVFLLLTILDQRCMLVSAGKKHRFPFITKSRENKGGSKESPSTSSYPSSLATLALPAPPSSTFTSSSSSSGSSSSKHNYGTQQLALEFYPKEELENVKIVEDVYGIWAADLRVLVQRAGNTAKGAAERMHVREQLWGIIQRYKPTRPLLLNAFDSFSVKKLATISSSSSTIQSEAATGFAPGELLVEYLRGLELIENALISCCKKDEWSPNDMDKSDIRQPLLNTLWLLNDKEAQTRFLNVLKKSGTHLVTLSTLLGHDSQFLFAPPSRISNRFQKKSWDVSDWLIKKKLNANGHLNDDAFFEQLNEALNLIQHIHTNLYENDAAKRKKTPAKKGKRHSQRNDDHQQEMRLDQESFRFLYKLIWSMPPHADIIAAIHDSPLSMTKMEQLKSVSTFKALAEGRTVLFTESIPHLNLLDGNDFEEQWQEKLKLFYLWQMEELWVELKMDNTRMSVRDQLIGVFLHGYHHFFIHVLVKARPHRLIKPFKDYLSAKMIEKRAADENGNAIVSHKDAAQLTAAGKQEVHRNKKGLPSKQSAATVSGLADRNTAAAKQKNKEKEFMGAFEDFLGVKFPERI